MKGITVSVVVLVLIVLAGAVGTVWWQATLADKVNTDWAANEAGAESAPQQTVVASWAIMDEVASVGSVIVWSTAFLAISICASAIAVVLRLGALQRCLDGANAATATVRAPGATVQV